MSIGNLYGFFHLQAIARQASTGYPMGSLLNPDVVAPGTTTHAYKFTGPVEISSLSPTYERVTWFGGMSNQGQVDLGLSEIGTMELSITEHDSDWLGWLSGAGKNTTLATANVLTAPNIGRKKALSIMLIATIGYNDMDGGLQYLHWMWNNLQVRRGNLGAANQATGQNPNNLTFVLTPQRHRMTPFGLPYEELGLSVAEMKDVAIEYKTSYPISVTTYVADDADTEFTLGYLPVFEDHAGVHNVFSINGEENNTAVTDVDGETGDVTTSSRTEDDVIVAVYETEFEPIPVAP